MKIFSLLFVVLSFSFIMLDGCRFPSLKKRKSSSEEKQRKNKIGKEKEKKNQQENKKARVMLTQNKQWFNVLHYDISVSVYPKETSLRGFVIITYGVVSSQSLMELDLQLPLQVDSILYYSEEEGKVVMDSAPILKKQHKFQHKRRLMKKYPHSSLVTTTPIRVTFSRMQERIYVQVPKDKQGAIRRLKIYYQGQPRKAVAPPWQGGMVWNKDSLGRDFIGLATQEAGASVWMPCKDYWGDKAERGASVAINVPKGLQAISNGTLVKTESDSARSTFYWQVYSPISPYNITMYVGAYQHWEMPPYEGIGGKLRLSYWALDYHQHQATLHFTKMPTILRSFEYWMGVYPFYKDPFQLVEAPYLGMEYQSAIAYGNGYKNGYNGEDRSASGFGNYWDYILVHETAHQWFGNNVSALSPRDMWIQESFATYAETLFTESLFSALAGMYYVKGQRALVRNKTPILTDSFQYMPDADMYYKGANMLHTLRTLIGNDAQFRSLLHTMNRQLTMPLRTEDCIQFISKFLGKNMSSFFMQYLQSKRIPMVQYKVDKKQGILSLKWAHTREDFAMPIKILGKEYTLRKNKWVSINMGQQLGYLPVYLKAIEQNYYVRIEQVGVIK